jgi:hypothetical protein
VSICEITKGPDIYSVFRRVCYLAVLFRIDMKKYFFFLMILILTSDGLLFTQTIIKPNYALKSHETLDIVKVELKAEATIFYMTIENRIKGGSFCADKNINLVPSDGKKTRLESATGIPVCPETYKFKTPGERLDFVLTFPPLKKDIESIDLVEECEENCFSFYGLILDGTLNQRIDNAYIIAENNEPTKALISFITIAEDISANKKKIPALLYLNIIKLAIETGDGNKAEEWYNKLKLSDIRGLSGYIRYLSDQGIRY